MAQCREHLPLTGVARVDSRTRRNIWVEFVVGSLLCAEGFFSGYSCFPPRTLVFPSPQKRSFPNSISIQI